MESLNPLDQIQLPVILGVIAIVGVTFLALRRLFFAPYVRVMEERERALEAAESTLAEAAAIAETVEPEAARLIAEARERADDVLRTSSEADDAYRKDAIAAAMAGSSAALEAGRAGIAAGREGRETQLRDRAIECVSLACGKLLGPTEPDAVSAVVDKLLARRVRAQG